MSKTPRDKNVPGQVTAKRRGWLDTPPHSLYTTTRTTIIPGQTTLNVKLSRRIRSSNHISQTSAPSTPYSLPRIKVFVILMTVFSTIFSPFSSFIYLPAMNPIAKSYRRSLGEINLAVPSTKSCRPLHHYSLAISATRSADGPSMRSCLPST